VSWVRFQFPLVFPGLRPAQVCDQLRDLIAQWKLGLTDNSCEVGSANEIYCWQNENKTEIVSL